jgi:xylulokinase
MSAKTGAGGAGSKRADVAGGVRVFLGVDIGTQGVKAAAFDTEGRCLAESFRPSELLRPVPGAVEEDPERQVRSVCETIAECAAKIGANSAGQDARRGAVAGIAIDGQMAGVIGVGDDGRAVTPYDSWLDTRCAPYIERMQREAGPEIVRKAGGPPSFNHGPKILWWKDERPDAWARIRSFVQPGGYAAMRLCAMDGAKAFIDASYLHFSGFADTRAGVWDPDLCRRFGVDPGKLPRIAAPHDVVGSLSPPMARECGLEPGVPVVAGCGDTAASFLSCGATRAGICVDVAGTASVFAATTSAFKPDERAMVLSCGRSATPGLWHPYAYINGGGMNLEWFKRDLAGAFASAGQALPEFDRLNAMAAAVQPSEDDPLFVPHLGGRVSPGRPRLRGAWVGLSWNHGPGHLFRAVLEGVALEYGIYLRTLEALFGAGTVREVRVTGGGEKSAVWNRIKADTLGVPVVQVKGAGGAPLGAALLAGHGAGALPDLGEAAERWIRTGTVTEPDPRRADAARARIERYASLLAALERWTDGE